ncbi:MAG TPA: FAD:protein FMN transferase [Gaiellaceae bacterium]
MFHTAAFDAIGVRNQVTVRQPDALPEATAIAQAAVAELDRTCSRFRDDSELSRLNAAGSAVVSPLLLELIRAALDAARWSDGLVDPTVGAALRSLGYDVDFDAVVRRKTRQIELVPAVGWRGVRVDHTSRRVTLARGAELDLGATAKAFAADRIANRVAAATGSPTLVSLGGDVAVAGEPPADGWPVAVTDDSRGDSTHPQTVAIRDGGLATSSTTVRRWQSQGGVMHHIVDPATGAPAAEVWRTASVTAATCLAANVAATAAILRGDAAPSWLEAHRLPARLVRRDGSVVRVGGWPA